ALPRLKREGEARNEPGSSPRERKRVAASSNFPFLYRPSARLKRPRVSWGRVRAACSKAESACGWLPSAYCLRPSSVSRRGLSSSSSTTPAPRPSVGAGVGAGLCPRAGAARTRTRKETSAEPNEDLRFPPPTGGGSGWGVDE